MSFYGNVVNPQAFYKSITVDDKEVLSILEGGDNLTLSGNEFLTVEKVSESEIRISPLVLNGLYLQCSDDSNKYFKIMIDSKGVLSIYEVEKKKEAN
jgi:hypothetical protein